MTDQYLSTVRMTIEPPDEQNGALIEVAVTSRLHPAYLINAVVVAAEAAARATMPDHPFHAGPPDRDAAPVAHMRDSATVTIDASGLGPEGVLVLPGFPPPGATITAEPTTHVVDENHASWTLCGVPLEELHGANTAVERHGIVLPARVNCRACRSAA